jgi:hypothetical protein
MGERGDPARNRMPSGFLVIDIQGDGGCAGLPEACEVVAISERGYRST